MKQFLRSFLTLLMLVVWASGFAQDTETIDLTKQGFKNQDEVSVVTGTDVTLSFAKDASSTNAPKYYTNKAGNAVRLYSDGTLKISSTSKKIGEIDFTIVESKGNLDQKFFSEGTYTQKSFTWKGSTKELTIKPTNTIWFQKLVITFVKEGPSKTATTLTFPETAISINGGDEASFKGQPAKLCAGEQELTGKTIKYAHTGDDIFATFDGTTGAATLKSGVYGTAKVTATYVGDDTYEGSEASYTVKIVDPNAIETTFDFTKPGNYDYGTSSSSSHKGDLDDNGGQIISNGVVITSTSTNDTPNRFWKDGLRVYDNSKLVISASGYKIVNVTTEGAQYRWTYNNNGTAVCDVTKATLTSMTVTMSPLPQVTFFENKDNDDALKTYDKKTVNTTLTRTLVANKWNTFCVPFDTEIAGTALEGATVKAIGTIVGNVINLEDATKIEAGVPYLVKPTTGNIENPTFKGVTISVTTPKKAGNDEYKFVGTYSPKKITEGEFGKIWGVTAQGKLAKINADTTMKGLRAYFVFLTNTAAAKLNFDGETTGINNIETEATVNGKVYNLNGQYVGNSLNGLKKGIYVVNGKKVIK